MALPDFLQAQKDNVLDKSKILADKSKILSSPLQDGNQPDVFIYGVTNPSLKTLFEIAKYYDIQPSVLIKLNEDLYQKNHLGNFPRGNYEHNTKIFLPKGTLSKKAEKTKNL